MIHSSKSASDNTQILLQAEKQMLINMRKAEIKTCTEIIEQNPNSILAYLAKRALYHSETLQNTECSLQEVFDNQAFWELTSCDYQFLYDRHREEIHQLWQEFLYQDEESPDWDVHRIDSQLRREMVEYALEHEVDRLFYRLVSG